MVMMGWSLFYDALCVLKKGGMRVACCVVTLVGVVVCVWFLEDFPEFDLGYLHVVFVVEGDGFEGFDAEGE
jgi:hypothetical protein